MERDHDNKGLLHVIARKREVETNDGELVPLVTHSYAIFQLTDGDRSRWQQSVAIALMKEYVG